MPDTGGYARATRDGDYRARLAAEFAAAGGEGDLLDELWWRERGEQDHPRGVPRPNVERRSLSTAAYSPAASPEAAAAASGRLAEFEARRTRQERALDAALALTAVRRPSGGGAGGGGGAGPTVSGRRAEESPILRFAGRHRITLGVGALILAAGVGALAAGTAVRPGATAPRPTAAASAPRTASVLSRALARVQVPTDALPAAFRGDVDERSSRLLYDDDPTDQATEERWRLWVATGENPRQLCYLSTYDNVTDAVSCVPRAGAFTERFVLSQSTPDGRFEMLVVDGAVAVQVD